MAKIISWARHSHSIPPSLSDKGREPNRAGYLPAPERFATGESVNFDAVLLASEPSPSALVPLMEGAFGDDFRVELPNLAGESKPVTLNLERLGGSYYRAVFEFPAQGMWSWSLVGPEARPPGATPLPAGILAVSPR